MGITLLCPSGKGHRADLANEGVPATGGNGCGTFGWASSGTRNNFQTKSRLRDAHAIRLTIKTIRFHAGCEINNVLIGEWHIRQAWRTLRPPIFISFTAAPSSTGPSTPWAPVPPQEVTQIVDQNGRPKRYLVGHKPILTCPPKTGPVINS